jgi:NAD(P)-dependent dehydrogenase (short-subunit alcohol dehydrogenase family)
MKKLEGWTVLIISAARGIGASAARLRAREGARLALVDMLGSAAAHIGEGAGRLGDRG